MPASGRDMAFKMLSVVTCGYAQAPNSPTARYLEGLHISNRLKCYPQPITYSKEVNPTEDQIAIFVGTVTSFSRYLTKHAVDDRILHVTQVCIPRWHQSRK